MGDLKLEHVEAVDPDYLVSGDMSCLMHLSGLAEREHRPLKTLHFVQILRDALHNRHGQATH
jgi:L-lactate dehydrogenase complex protein LldE